MPRKKTTHVRMYRDDVMELRMKFPKTKMPELLHIGLKTNPLLQMEAALRRNDTKKTKQKR